MRRHLSFVHSARRHVLLALVLPLLLVLLVFSPSNARSTITWRGDFETGNLSQWVTTQAKDASRVTVQSNVLRQGRYASRFEVRPGDNNVAGSGSGERAEVYVGDATTEGHEGREQWWAWSTLWDQSFQPSTSNTMWNYFTQFHNTGSSGQANVAWNSPPDNTIRLRVCNGGNPESPSCTYFTLDSNRQNGRWYDFVFHVKWSSDPSVGFVEMWENGQRVVPFTRIATLYPGQGVYLKQGYYRSAHTSTAVLYHDGMRRGASYEEVAAEFPSSAQTGSFSVSSSIGTGASLSGTVLWKATTAGSTASSVTFSIEDEVVATDTTSPFELSLDTTKLANVPYTFRVDATATDGRKASATSTATVNNPSTSAFAVQQNLADGQNVKGMISWAATTSGKTVSRVDYSVEGQQVATDNTAPFDVSFDTSRLGDGLHPFAVKAYATDGTTAVASANVNVANAVPAGLAVTQNVSDGMTLAGSYKWTASPTGLSVAKVEFYIDSELRSTERYAPYVFGGDDQMLDTRNFQDGRHVLEVRAYSVDGSLARSAATVSIANAVASGGSTPTLVSNISDGQTVSGQVSWTVEPSGFAVSRIEFYIDTKLMWTERLAPYVYGGDGQTLDTRTLANGSHTLELRGYATDGSWVKAVATVSVSNGTTPGGTPSPTIVSSIKDGDKISGLVPWTVEVQGFDVARIEFYIDSKLTWTERLTPYVYGGDNQKLDASALGRGRHDLEVRAIGTDGSTRSLKFRVVVN